MEATSSQHTRSVLLLALVSKLKKRREALQQRALDAQNQSEELAKNLQVNMQDSDTHVKNESQKQVSRVLHAATEDVLFNHSHTNNSNN